MAATWVSKIGCGMQLRLVPDDLDVLPGGVEHLHHLLVRHQLEERREVDARRQRVDHDGFVGAGHLGDAEQRIVGGLAQELGVDGHEGIARQPLAGVGQVLGRGNEFHQRLSIGVGAPRCHPSKAGTRLRRRSAQPGTSGGVTGLCIDDRLSFVHRSCGDAGYASRILRGYQAGMLRQAWRPARRAPAAGR